MIESTINNIFPTPIYFSKIGRKLTKVELKFINSSKKIFNKNDGNISTKNTYILNEAPFSNIKKELDTRVKDYFNKIICSDNNITPYITQSWLNYTEKNEYHHKHQHQNSLISGVFYINCDEQFDNIKFFNENYSAIKLDIKKWNIWNSESWWFSVKSGDIILFPSSLLHMVETKKGDNTRISLAFNVFIKGNIGNNQKATELILK